MMHYLNTIKGLALPLASVMTMTLAQGAEFHVSPTGSDTNPGDKDHPFRTVTKARDAVRAVRAAKPEERCEVILQDGVYPLTDSLTLGKEDSGTESAPVVYRAENPGRAKIIGGINLEASDFKPCTDEAILKRLSPSARGKVLSCPLGQKDPNLKIPQVPKSFRGVIDLPFLYADGKPQTLARWPNSGWASFTKVIDNGLSGGTPSHSAVKREAHPGAFQLDDPRPAKWNIDEGVWLFGFWTHDWYDEVLEIGSYDPKSKAIRLAAPHCYGLGEKTIGNNKGRHFYAFNLLEELDAPGEWYIDRKSNQLLYYPQGTPNSLILSSLTNPLVSARDVSNIEFSGIEFSHTKGDGLLMVHPSRITVRDCHFAAIGKTGATFKEATECVVQHCDIEEMGACGVSMAGGDRKNLVKGNNRVENCHIHHFGQFMRTGAPAVRFGGCGNVMRNCRIHDAPHLAVGFSGNDHVFEYNDISRVLQDTADAGAFYTGRDWTNQGNLIRYNYIHDIGIGGRGQADYIMSVYLDDCVCGITVRGNIFCRAARAIQIGGGRDNIVEDNLIVDSVTGISLDARGTVWKEWNTPLKGWNLQEKAEAFNYRNPPWSIRYPNLAKTMGNSPKEPIGTTIRNNCIVNAGKSPFVLAAGADKIIHKLSVEGNIVAVTKGNGPKGGVRGVPLKTPVKGFENRTLPAGWKLPENARGVPEPAQCAPLLQLMPKLKDIPTAQIGQTK